MEIIRLSQLVETPWKNGGGITRNIAEHRDAKGPLWRLSMADVERDGAFSNFAGLTRVLTVIKGDGMILQSPTGDIPAKFAQPVTFDGATAIHAQLTQGPIRDFNLMFDTARCTASAKVIQTPGAHSMGGPDHTSVLHIITASATLDPRDTTLETGDTALLAKAELRFHLAPSACALAITLSEPPD